MKLADLDLHELVALARRPGGLPAIELTTTMPPGQRLECLGFVGGRDVDGIAEMRIVFRLNGAAFALPYLDLCKVIAACGLVQMHQLRDALALAELPPAAPSAPAKRVH